MSHKATVHGIRARRAKRIDAGMANKLHSLYISPQLKNVLGTLTPAIHKRLRQLHHNPQLYWERDHGISLGEHTLWQAIVLVDPTFPKCGPRYAGGIKLDDWERYPDPKLIEQALLLMAPAGEV